jgi:hypothetical protein
MAERIGKIVGYAIILAISLLGVYNLGYLNGRYDLIREPTRKEYEQMGWGYDENEPQSQPGCWRHLDGNGDACAPRCRPNCYVNNWFRGIKVDDY